MPLEPGTMRTTSRLAEVAVFVSASIPDPARWPGDFDPLEITDAVTAAARAVLTESGTVVTAAHPTIAPLLLYVAAEFPLMAHPSIVVYQSHLFSGMLPEATQRFEQAGTGIIKWTAAVEGEAPEPGRWDRSLRLMRETMIREAGPVAAIFIGGMEGVIEEHSLFEEALPGRPWYALGRPGGVARELASQERAGLRDSLLSGGIYPSLFRRVVSDIAASLPPDQQAPA
jgi:hypothetical protein